MKRITNFIIMLLLSIVVINSYSITASAIESMAIVETEDGGYVVVNPDNAEELEMQKIIFDEYAEMNSNPKTRSGSSPYVTLEAVSSETKYRVYAGKASSSYAIFKSSSEGYNWSPAGNSGSVSISAFGIGISVNVDRGKLGTLSYRINCPAYLVNKKVYLHVYNDIIVTKYKKYYTWSNGYKEFKGYEYGNRIIGYSWSVKQ